MSVKQRVVAIVQARMVSSRFPGKMTQKLGRRRLIDWVLLRMLRCRHIDQLVLATSVAGQNDVLREIAAGLGVPVVSGSEDDVLGRFSIAARQFDADHVVRICADNPFIDPVEVDRLVTTYLDRLPDYGFNHVPRLNNNYPDGLGAEILSDVLLQRIASVAVMPQHREHVTLYIWDNASEYRIETVQAPDGIAFPEVKLDIDTPADLARLQKIASDLDTTSSAQTIVNAYRSAYSFA